MNSDLSFTCTCERKSLGSKTKLYLLYYSNLKQKSIVLILVIISIDNSQSVCFDMKGIFLFVFFYCAIYKYLINVFHKAIALRRDTNQSKSISKQKYLIV